MAELKYGLHTEPVDVWFKCYHCKKKAKMNHLIKKVQCPKCNKGYMSRTYEERVPKTRLKYALMNIEDELRILRRKYIALVKAVEKLGRDKDDPVVQCVGSMLTQFEDEFHNTAAYKEYVSKYQ